MRFHAFGASRDEVAATMEAAKVGVVRLNDELYASVASKGAEWRSRVDAWHDRALHWMELTGKVLDDPSKLPLWKKVGTDLSNDASGMATDANASRALEFALGMPAAIAKVVVWTAGTAGKAVGAAASGVGFSANKVLLAGGVVVLAYALIPKLLSRR